MRLTVEFSCLHLGFEHNDDFDSPVREWATRVVMAVLGRDYKVNNSI